MDLRRAKDIQRELGVEPSNCFKFLHDIEEVVINMAPKPISYDVSTVQKSNFSEYTYTGYMGGVLVQPQSTEISLRLIKEASTVPADKDYLALVDMKDKYKQSTEANVDIDKVMFLTGGNLFHTLNIDYIQRILFYDESVMVKLHPITVQEDIELMGKIVGWDRIIPPEISAQMLLDKASCVYGTMASELMSFSVIRRINIKNISLFHNQSESIYYAILDLLFRESSVEKRYELLNNIIGCEFSGVIMPFHGNTEERLEKFYAKSIELRELFKPLSNQYITNKYEFIKE